MLYFAIINVSIEDKMPFPFKQCFLNCNLFDNNFDECFEENEIEKSPINNITNKQWSILKKLDNLSGQCFQDIFDSIDKNKFVMPFENVTIEARREAIIINPETGKKLGIIILFILSIIGLSYYRSSKTEVK